MGRLLRITFKIVMQIPRVQFVHAHFRFVIGTVLLSFMPLMLCANQDVFTVGVRKVASATVYVNVVQKPGVPLYKQHYAARNENAPISSNDLIHGLLFRSSATNVFNVQHQYLPWWFPPRGRRLSLSEREINVHKIYLFISFNSG